MRSALPPLVMVSALWIALTGAALADTLPIKGSYGNKDGCAYAKTGESTGSDNFFLLTPEAMTTAASYCTFKKLLKTEGKSFTVSVTCEAEGEEKSSEFTAQIQSGPKGYTITFVGDPGTKWGPLPLCK